MKAIDSLKLKLKPVKTREQYKEYLTLIDSLADCGEGSPEEEVLKLVSILVEDYETRHYPIEAPDPIEAIKLKMEEEGLKRKDLAPYFGSISRVSEVLNRKRLLTLGMIKKTSSRAGYFSRNIVSGIAISLFRGLSLFRIEIFRFLRPLRWPDNLI